ncbi:transglycosylase [Mycolicibacterium parafortuitum]|uniref:Transglycosylase n=1 Tax=Mycolicibacterium parafortuitum TaxID=39692 RepID=A0A7I7U972_MYCPF|nr:GlsB/YeaQ/YmgE family stress response membrane protein [Mycolicibacterium parafortuitum]PQE02035.1 GlsB/YeaQ/YmgE family stress response membrane protein [Mycobacterium sp. EPG1]BBY77665.1 transglycosylase [Mycolicibacterium parafortuitum]
MTITGIITAILVGIVVGVLARLVLPGKQKIGVLLTVLVGIVAALVGTALARAMGLAAVAGDFNFGEFIVQVVVAVAGVALVTALMGRRRTGLMGGRRSGILR